MNLIDVYLANGQLDIGTFGSAFQTPLLAQGFRRNPAFGGTGPSTLSGLDSGIAYVTLVPRHLVEVEVNASLGGFAANGLDWETLEVAYILTPFDGGDYNQDGHVDAADFTGWARNVGQPVGTLPVDPWAGITASPIGDPQFVVWRDNFNTSSGTNAAMSVPEPKSGILLATVGVGVLARSTRRRDENRLSRFGYIRECRKSNHASLQSPWR
ncbi:MAG: hypothetical protein O3C60_08115 [Planctomycetota bacterium]|nr:hypothetical protein [Planctomycetota bacterium]